MDGENFRQRLVDLFLSERLIRSKSANFKVNVRGLIEDVIGQKGIQINYYASEIKTPVGYNPSNEIMNQINTIRENSRRWVSMLKS